MAPNKVKQYRERQGIKQSALAMRVDITQGEISRIEKGQRVPSVYTALMIARELHAPVSEPFPLDERN